MLIGMRGVLTGYIALLLQHLMFGMRHACCGFVARTVGTQGQGRRGRTIRKAAGHLPATKGCGRHESAAYCRQITTCTLQMSGPCSEEGATPAKEVDSGASASTPAARGILTPLKERIASSGDEVPDSLLLYFAFGANMSPSILTDKRDVKPLTSFPAEATTFATTGSGKDGTGAGEGLCMCFCHRAGYATLAPKPGPPQSWEASPGIHGVVHAISSSDLKNIAASENGYRKRMVEVETPAGERDVAVCFVSEPSQTLPTSVPPTSRYLALLQDGAAYHGVNERYCRWLEELPSVPSEQEATSPERINTPSKTATDAVVTAVVAAALGAAVVALSAR